MENTETKTVEQCRAQLTRESVIKAVLCGMAIGLGVSFVIAFTTWFFEFKGMWLSLAVGAVVWAASAVLFYFYKFRPTTADVMKRLDRAGLDERMITMYELQGNDSVMASLQRADASATFTKAVASTGGKLLATKIPTFIIALACSIGSIGVASNVITGLSDYDIIPTGTELVTGNWEGGYNSPSKRYYTVTFTLDDENIGGLIDENAAIVARAGVNILPEITKQVRAGNDTDPVTIVENPKDEDGGEYYFVGWFDETGKLFSTAPRFTLENVTKSITLKAKYEPLENGDIGFGYYYNPSDQNSDEPGESSENSPGDPSQDNAPPKPGGPSMPGPGGGSPADTSNTIIDGDTQYEENFDYYYQLAMEMLANGTGNYPPELVELIEGYFGIL